MNEVRIVAAKKQANQWLEALSRNLLYALALLVLAVCYLQYRVESWAWTHWDLMLISGLLAFMIALSLVQTIPVRMTQTLERLTKRGVFELSEPALADLPVVVFTGKELTVEEQNQLKGMAKSIILKDVQSPERLLDETALFLHRVVTELPAEKQGMIERLNGSSEIMRGRKILVVDDDARNIFALTSLLENQEMEVISATNGRSAIEIVTKTPDLSMVLMDIMMPEMDGYATIREIRTVPEFRTIPILALTAKAMKGDREKCLDAGASDYIAKPVNTDQLLSLMRVWLFR